MSALDHASAMGLFQAMMERLANSFRVDPSGRPLLAIHFGSTARGVLRSPTDIDLFLVFQDLPVGRFERQRLFDVHESTVAGDLAALRAGGYDLCFSPQIHAPDALERFKRIYLDFPEDGRLLFDAEGEGKRLMERIRSMRERQGIRQESVGGMRIWNCRGSLPPGKPFVPDF